MMGQIYLQLVLRLKGMDPVPQPEGHAALGSETATCTEDFISSYWLALDEPET